MTLSYFCLKLICDHLNNCFFFCSFWHHTPLLNVNIIHIIHAQGQYCIASQQYCLVSTCTAIVLTGSKTIWVGAKGDQKGHNSLLLHVPPVELVLFCQNDILNRLYTVIWEQDSTLDLHTVVRWRLKHSKAHSCVSWKWRTDQVNPHWHKTQEFTCLKKRSLSGTQMMNSSLFSQHGAEGKK